MPVKMENLDDGIDTSGVRVLHSLMFRCFSLFTLSDRHLSTPRISLVVHGRLKFHLGSQLLLCEENSHSAGHHAVRRPEESGAGRLSTFAYGVEFKKLTDLSAIGGIVVKGLSRQPMDGNAPPRMYETEGGMMNSIGLQNIGVRAFVVEKLPALREAGPRFSPMFSVTQWRTIWRWSAFWRTPRESPPMS